MKRIYLIRTLLAVACVLSLGACKKLPDGFLSPIIRYEEDPILIAKGRVYVSSALNFDGSSKPAKIKLLHVYNKTTGQNVDDLFFKKDTIKVWTALYDPKTDTTLEKIAAKQTDAVVPPIIINESSGQLEANFQTLYIPSGDYSFDLEISNGAGSKVYEKIGNFTLLDKRPFEAHPEIGTPYIRMIKVGNEGLGANLTKPEEVEVDIQRTGDAPNKVIVKMVDKNGIPFSPQGGEIERRPNTGNNPTPPFLQTLQDYSLKSELFSDRMEFTYGTIPFPLASLGNGYNIYYRIPTQFFSHDNQASYPDGQWSANPRFVFRAYVPGTYVITFKAKVLTHK
ncbi:DUF5007 domain-containing protein [Terrimonas pollutisoli]|uniref:DUF5007 domain-containing protein n=1 Tax=Terrimonas pollutisoli TaxID=3034147 RepID=UPI0023EB9DB3|nr:DUF5007 domain-containing protein [Terrimonas sp. H1YJ31]